METGYCTRSTFRLTDGIDKDLKKKKDTRLNWFNEIVWLAGYFLELRSRYYVCVHWQIKRAD